MYDVLCVGILVADVIVKPVKIMPEKGVLSPVDSIELYSGGNAMNVAINLKKLGVSSALVGMIGKDMFGEFLKSCLEKNNVSIASVKATDKVPTAASVLLISDEGERSFWHCEGANGVLSIDDIDFDIVKKSNIVFVTGTYLMNTFDGEQTVDFLKQCKRLGKTTVLDVCWDSKGRWGKILNPAFPYIDIFMPSIDEARQISEEENVFKMAEKFMDRGAGSVVIKCGSDGCYVKESKTHDGYMMPAFKGISAVDTTGAGDSFCSGFLAALSKGLDFKNCALIGNAAGAHCVMDRGATTGMKSYKEICEFIHMQEEI